MEQKSFADIFEDVTKQAVKIQKKDYLPTGRYPIIDQGQEWCAGYTDREDGLFQDVPAYIFGDHTRIIKYTDEPFYLGADGVKLLKLREGIQANPRFFYYALKSQRIPDTGYNRHFKWLKESLYHVPTLNEQTHIADTLDTLSTLITLCKTKIFLFDELVKSRFIEMCGDPVTNPMGWENVPLSELAEIRIGPFGTLLHKEDYIEGGHPLVNPSHIYEGNIVTDSKLTISDEKYEELSAYHLYENDVVMGRRGEMGRCAVVTDSGLLCGTGSMVIRPLGEVRADFLQKIISFPSFKKMLEDMAVGQTMPNLNVPIVSRLEIIKPPSDVQDAYYDFVALTDKSKLVLRQLLEKQCTLKAALMQEYFAAH